MAEFTLLTHQFTAENGHSAGGQFNIVTKSGTKTGTAWGYNRKLELRALTTEKQRGTKNRFDYNRAGASWRLVIHNKFFV